MGRDTETLIVPHLGEFDQRRYFKALITKILYSVAFRQFSGKYDIIVDRGK